ncbi:SGNH/GDSL hydrolase family protein [Hymenobacter mucosus]|uniref:Sialate O-acetylesterase domain-containing protein n=1 Tax=Hymenobacter mucosus TaxID=1411120 RepID=A0A238W856_9BACT|nr:hypothetical protein [Hymenobacter mucosus]SNR42756.1 hypothetical protein SAMN06269173_102325 [Hymenobacter mucosus]
MSLLIGVNNQCQGLPLATYRPELRELLRLAVRSAGGRAGRVVMLPTPAWGQSPYARNYDPACIATKIDQHNPVAQEECQLAAVSFVNITDRTRAAEPTPFANDGLRYSGQQMQQWALRTRQLLQQC